MRGPADVVRAAGQLAVLPAIYLRLSDVANDPHSSAEAVAAVVAEDPVLTVRLLRLVNSAVYGFPGRVETVPQALGVIGTSQVLDLALATAVMRNFAGVPPEVMDLEAFWRHSIGVAVASRRLALHRRQALAERLFVGGLLHDIGRLLLALDNGPGLTGIAIRAARSRVPMHDVERECLGFDHADVGRTLLAAWNLPLSLQEIVGYHHRPAAAEHHGLECSLVHLADVLVNALGLGTSGNRVVPPPVDGVWEIAGVGAADMDQLVVDIERQYADVVQIMLLFDER